MDMLAHLSCKPKAEHKGKKNKKQKTYIYIYIHTGFETVQLLKKKKKSDCVAVTERALHSAEVEIHPDCLGKMKSRCLNFIYRKQI